MSIDEEVRDFLVVAATTALASDRPDRAPALKEHSWENRVVKITQLAAVLIEYTPVSVLTGQRSITTSRSGW